MISADGLADGSIASRPSDDTDGVGSASSVARSKNCRSADCSMLSYSAPTASAGGVDTASDHNSEVQRDTLIDFFRDLVTIRGDFLVYDDGYRRRVHTYEEVGRAARGFAARLRAAGVGKTDKVVFWGENRPEWIACYWGCLIAGAIVVPIDYRSSTDFVRKVRQLVEARVILLGDDVPGCGAGDDLAGIEQWPF